MLKKVSDFDFKPSGTSYMLQIPSVYYPNQKRIFSPQNSHVAQENIISVIQNERNRRWHQAPGQIKAVLISKLDFQPVPGWVADGFLDSTKIGMSSLFGEKGWVLFRFSQASSEKNYHFSHPKLLFPNSSHFITWALWIFYSSLLM